MAILRTAWAGIAALLAAVALTGLAPGEGRRLRGALAACDVVAPPARAGDGGRVLRLRQEAGVGRGAHRRRRLARARARPPDVRDLRRRAPGRLRARAARAGPRRACARRGRARVRPRAGGRGGRVAGPDRAGHRVAQPVRRRTRPRARALPGPGGHLLGGQLPSRPRDAGTSRRRRDRRARRRSARCVRLAQALVGIRARRRRWRMLAILLHPTALHAVLGWRVALAGAARGRLRAARRGVRRRSGRARPARVLVGDPGCAGSGNRARARVPGRVHVPPRRGRPGDRGVDRARRRGGGARRRRRARKKGNARRPGAAVGGGCGRVRVAGGDLRLRPLGGRRRTSPRRSPRGSSSGSGRSRTAPSSSRTTRRPTGRPRSRPSTSSPLDPATWPIPSRTGRTSAATT